jgi:signal transduction histidine kinase
MDTPQLLDQWIRIQEQRLASLGYELHDGPSQYLIAAMHHLEGFRLLQAKGSAEAWEEFDHGLDLLQRGIGELRSLMRELRPASVAEGGIVEAVENLVHENAISYGMLTAFSHNLAEAAFSPVMESTIFRIVQESLNNVRRHSHSRRARVEILQQNDRLHVTVEDWGIGFDPSHTPATCMGLEGIRARAALLGGKAAVTSRPGQGTQVSVDLPVPQAVCPMPAAH